MMYNVCIYRCINIYYNSKPNWSDTYFLDTSLKNTICTEICKIKKVSASIIFWYIIERLGL